MIITYEECEISKSVIDSAYALCVANPNIRAGICCSSLEQLHSLKTDIEDVLNSNPPWNVENWSAGAYADIIEFDNGSILELCVATDSLRGQRFHYLRVDHNTDTALCSNVLSHLIRPYPLRATIFQEERVLGASSEYESLLEFAEEKINAPLSMRQKDMLINLYNGTPCVVDRSVGRSAMTKIYSEWAQSRPETGEPCEYTYDQVMAGISHEK